MEQIIQQLGKELRWIKQKHDGSWLAQARGTSFTDPKGQRQRTSDFVAKGKTPLEALQKLKRILS